MAIHQMAGLHVYSNPNLSGGNGLGFGPLVNLPPGSYQCHMDVRGAGTIKLVTAAGTVLASGPGGHRGGPLNLASATAVQFVVSGTNAGTTGAGGSIMLSDGRNWSE